MKADNAWGELRRILEQEGHDTLVETMNRLEKEEEPEYVYRLYYSYSPWSKNHSRVGSKHRMRCIINNGYRHDSVRVERTKVNWQDVTRDFVS